MSPGYDRKSSGGISNNINSAKQEESARLELPYPPDLPGTLFLLTLTETSRNEWKNQHDLTEELFFDNQS